MEISKTEIVIQKTARYFTSVTQTTEIKNIWFVCHGYAQSAEYFIKNFEPIANNETLIIACEGLHRFYLNGFNGKVVASWMTKEDRLSDIKDYINYLDSVYKEISQKYNINEAIINVLGFSQGGATVCRWLSETKHKVDNLILWASIFPPDIKFTDSLNIFNNIDTYILVGNEDEFVNEDEVNKHTADLEELKIKYTFLPFAGKHKIYPEPLLQLNNLIQKK